MERLDGACGCAAGVCRVLQPVCCFLQHVTSAPTSESLSLPLSLLACPPACPCRRDPDCVPAQRGLKRLRAVSGGKERGNAAFSEGRYEEAWQQYSAAMQADPALRTPFVAQVRAADQSSPQLLKKGQRIAA